MGEDCCKQTSRPCDEGACYEASNKYGSSSRDSQLSCPPVSSLIRDHARTLRDKAHNLETLADSMDNCCFSGNANNMLWDLLFRGLNK